jgi:hypothetical protein
MSIEVIAMLKTRLIGTCLALGLAACASTPSTPEAAKSPALAANDAPPAGCVQGTGSRLPSKPGDCTGFGNAYGKQQADATGKVWAQQQLFMMDTAIKINGSAQ